MFSLVPRCQGLKGVAEVDVEAGVDAQLGVLGHLGSLIPGEGSAQGVWQRCDRPGDRIADGLGAVARQGRPVVDAGSLAVAGHGR